MFGPISVRSPFCFPRDGDLPLTSKGKVRMTAGGEEEGRVSSEKGKEQGGRGPECVRIAPSIIFTREGARRREGGGRRGRERLLFVRISFPECQWVTCIDEDAATIPWRVREGRKARCFRRKECEEVPRKGSRLEGGEDCIVSITLIVFALDVSFVENLDQRRG